MNTNATKVVSDPFKRILDTEYFYGIPYVIDRKKYNEIFNGGEVGGTHLPPTDAVVFLHEECKDSDDNLYADIFYVYPTADVAITDMLIDVISYCKMVDGDDFMEKYESAVRSVLSCVQRVSVDEVRKQKEGIRKDIEESNAQIRFLDTLLPKSRILYVVAGVRYYEDAVVNGTQEPSYEEMQEGALPRIPCYDNGCWCLDIDVETGVILNWKKGTEAKVHYKVCDECGLTYKENDEVIASYDGYVSDFLSIDDDGYGDYICITIDGDGRIQRWNTDNFFKWIDTHRNIQK